MLSVNASSYEPPWLVPEAATPASASASEYRIDEYWHPRSPPLVCMNLALKPVEEELGRTARNCAKDRRDDTGRCKVAPAPGAPVGYRQAGVKGCRGDNDRISQSMRMTYR